MITLGDPHPELPVKLRDNSVFMLIDGMLFLSIIAIFVVAYILSVKSAEKKFPGHLGPRKPLWGYVNEADFDGTKARGWLVVTQVATAQKIGYPLTLTPGVSGVDHADAVCQNADASDFEITLDVSQYQEGIYSLALVIGYMKEGAKDPTYKYYPFSGDISFTVLNGQVVTPVTTVA